MHIKLLLTAVHLQSQSTLRHRISALSHHANAQSRAMPPADASLKRVSALIAQAAALGVHQNRLNQAKQACIDRDAAATAALQAAVHAEPFSRDIFRLRCMDASRLGLSTQAAQGTVQTGCFQQFLLLAT